MKKPKGVMVINHTNEPVTQVWSLKQTIFATSIDGNIQERPVPQQSNTTHPTVNTDE